MSDTQPATNVAQLEGAEPIVIEKGYGIIDVGVEVVGARCGLNGHDILVCLRSPFDSFYPLYSWKVG